MRVIGGSPLESPAYDFLLTSGSPPLQHLRLNDPDTARNPYINFTSSLQTYANHEEALHLLQALAAIYKPVMKTHGLHVNHLQEFEPNNEFAGRNWNAGENIEMVLRRRNDHSRFLPFGLICAVFAHELAHNVHMNHVPRLHGALTRQLTTEWKDLQKRGYYGDGFWSGGQRLGDESWRVGDAAGASASNLFPDTLCGGARRRRAAGNRKRRRRRQQPGNEATTTRHKKGTPSLHTGAQTAANTSRTAGKRRAVQLPGQGTRIDGRNEIPRASAKSSAYKLDENSTFRKRASTNAARDLRAAAAMRRIAGGGAVGGVDKGDDDEKHGEGGDLKAGAVGEQSVKSERRQQRSINDWMAAGGVTSNGQPSEEEENVNDGDPGESSHTEDEDEYSSHTEEEAEDVPAETPDDAQAQRQLGLEWQGLLDQVKCGVAGGSGGGANDQQVKSESASAQPSGSGASRGGKAAAVRQVGSKTAANQSVPREQRNEPAARAGAYATADSDSDDDVVFVSSNPRRG